MKIDYDKDMDRSYIPVCSTYEFQTKGKGSTFRIANTFGNDRISIWDSESHLFLETMARQINQEMNQLIFDNRLLRAIIETQQQVISQFQPEEK
jgi:hypothetical protein